VVSRGYYVQEQPERQAIRQFFDFMRIGDTESAYQAVEKMKFSDFVDALEAVQREGKPLTVSKRSAADRQTGRSLTEPPIGYQTPSPAQPYGIGKSTPRPTATPRDPAVGDVGSN
jgi:hypothetical protein